MNMTPDRVLLFAFVGMFITGMGIAWYAWANWAHHPRRRRRHA